MGPFLLLRSFLVFCVANFETAFGLADVMGFALGAGVLMDTTSFHGVLFGFIA